VRYRVEYTEYDTGQMHLPSLTTQHRQPSHLAIQLIYDRFSLRAESERQCDLFTQTRDTREKSSLSVVRASFSQHWDSSYVSRLAAKGVVGPRHILFKIFLEDGWLETLFCLLYYWK